MFNGVKGNRIKNFFKGRQGRNLRFASNKPVKIQAGFEIEEIAQSAVKNNTDNIIIASLKATIEDLKVQLDVCEDARLRAKLEWATEYLTKFEKKVEIIKTSKPPKTPKETKVELAFKNIERQRDIVLKKLEELSTTISKGDIEDIISKVEETTEQIRLYETSILIYDKKGGKEVYQKLTIGENVLKGLYKQIAIEIDSLKDELEESTEKKYEVKENIRKLEKFVNDLAKYAESPEKYNQIRTEIDMEIANKKRKKVTPPEPPRPLYQDAIEAYEKELEKLNNTIIELNKVIAKVEKLIQIEEITPDVLRQYIELSKQIANYRNKISSSKTMLQNIARSTREDYTINIEKLTYIQNINREVEQYNTDYDTYIELLDKKSVIVINKIKELLISKTNVSEKESNLINQEISLLYESLKAINSLIENRIVYHSRTHSEDIRALHQKHLENRKIIAAAYQITYSDSISQKTSEKKPEDILREKLLEITNRWLDAIKKAPISSAGKIDIDETIFADEITSLLTQVNNEEMLKIIVDCSNEFNDQRAQINKKKRSTLDDFRKRVETRLSVYFNRGPVTDNIVSGVHHTEWLTKIEYIDMLATTIQAEEKEYIPNLEQLIEKYIQEEDKRYQTIKKHQEKEQEKMKRLGAELTILPTKVDSLPIDEQFEENIVQILENLKEKYSCVNLQYQLNIENNSVTFICQTQMYEFNTGSYSPMSQEINCVIMGNNKFKEYQRIRGLNQEKPPVPPTKPQEEEPVGVKVELKDNEPNAPKVTNRTLKLATNRRQVINRAKNLIIKSAGSLTLSLIKQGLRIRYNENLRDQLKSLNAKLSLVNKSNYRSRKDIKVQDDETVQDLAFKTPKENFKIEDYKLEVRLVDSDRKRSDLLYTIDLDDISAELHARKL